MRTMQARRGGWSASRARLCRFAGQLGRGRGQRRSCNGSRNRQTAEQTGSAADSAADSSAFDAAAATARAERSRLARLRAHFRVLLDQLIDEYAAPESDHGLEIREVAGGFVLPPSASTTTRCAGFVRTLKPPLKLTLQSLETLAVVAYKQPVTAPEIPRSARGLQRRAGLAAGAQADCDGGRKHVIGRPILYKTTAQFLLNSD